MTILRQILVFDAADPGAEALALGARMLKPADDPAAAEGFQV